MASFRSSWITPAVCLMLLLSGCSKFDLRKGIPWVPGEDGELERPMKIVAVWTDAIMTHGSEAPVRGFGGRLMFYAREDADPLKVKGSLVVYAFNETGRDPRDVRPDRKYVFTEEEFEKHYSESRLGHSYSIWLPWDKIGGPQTEVSLLVKFTPTGGGLVTGEQQTVLLPGAAVPNYAPLPAGRTPFGMPPGGAPYSMVQQASYAAPIGGPMSPQSAAPTWAPGTYSALPQPRENSPDRRMSTVTIPIPARPGNRLPVAAPISTALPGAASSGQAAETSWPQPNLPAQQLNPKPGQQSARFGPGRLRPLGAPIAQLSRDHGPWQLSHAAPLSGPAAAPQSAPAH